VTSNPRPAGALPTALPHDPFFTHPLNAVTDIRLAVFVAQRTLNLIGRQASEPPFSPVTAWDIHQFVNPIGARSRHARRLPRVAVHRQPRCSDLMPEFRQAVARTVTDETEH
jgi:hypothetical protein